MKKICFVILILPLYVSCKYKSDREKIETDSSNMFISKSDNIIGETQNWSSIAPMEKSKIVNFSWKNTREKSSLNQYFLTSFGDMFPDITVNDINKIDFIEDAILRNWGKTSIYKFELSHRLPETIYKNGILIISEQKAQAAIFFLDNFDLVKLKETDTAYLLAGIHIVKSKGYFYLYDFDGDQYFQCKFSTLSDRYCKNGIPVYNNSLDCVCYKPFGLVIKNNDVNHDGLLDLIFTGNVLSFCEGLENGYGREDRKPISTFKLDIIFITNQNNNEIAWGLQDSSFCSKINR